MTAITNSFRQLFLLITVLCAITSVSAQGDLKSTTLPVRPSLPTSFRLVNVSTIDEMVTQSFNLLTGVDAVSSKVGIIESQLQGSIPDVTLLLGQVNECSNALGNIGTTAPALIESIVSTIGNIKNLHVPLLKIPLALKNLNEARKAVQYSVSCSKYLIATALPAIRQKTNPAEKVIISQN